LNRKLTILTIVALVVYVVVPVEAYPPGVLDADWEVYTSGDNVVKPGTTVQYRIWGTLHARSQTKAKLVVSIWVYEPTGWVKIYSYYILPEREYSDETPFNKTRPMNSSKTNTMNTAKHTAIQTQSTTRLNFFIMLSVIILPLLEKQVMS